MRCSFPRIILAVHRTLSNKRFVFFTGRVRPIVRHRARHTPLFSRDFTWKWEGVFSRILTRSAEKWVELFNFKIMAKRLLLVTVCYTLRPLYLCIIYLGHRNCRTNMHSLRIRFYSWRFHARNEICVFSLLSNAAINAACNRLVYLFHIKIAFKMKWYIYVLC